MDAFCSSRRPNRKAPCKRRRHETAGRRGAAAALRRAQRTTARTPSRRQGDLPRRPLARDVGEGQAGFPRRADAGKTTFRPRQKCASTWSSSVRRWLREGLDVRATRARPTRSPRTEWRAPRARRSADVRALRTCRRTPRPACASARERARQCNQSRRAARVRARNLEAWACSLGLEPDVTPVPCPSARGRRGRAGVPVRDLQINEQLAVARTSCGAFPCHRAAMVWRCARSRRWRGRPEHQRQGGEARVGGGPTPDPRDANLAATTLAADSGSPMGSSDGERQGLDDIERERPAAAQSAWRLNKTAATRRTPCPTVRPPGKLTADVSLEVLKVGVNAQLLQQDGGNRAR